MVPDRDQPEVGECGGEITPGPGAGRQPHKSERELGAIWLLREPKPCRAHLIGMEDELVPSDDVVGPRAPARYGEVHRAAR